MVYFDTQGNPLESLVELLGGGGERQRQVDRRTRIAVEAPNGTSLIHAVCPHPDRVLLPSAERDESQRKIS